MEFALAVHVVQCDAPVAAEYVPASQSWHDCPPDKVLNFPGAQAAHNTPARPLKPGLHSHLLLPAAESELSPQAAQLMVANESENLPAAQSTHSADPVDALYFPASHAEHASCTPVYPALQTHSLLPASACESKGHSWQRRAAKTLENSPAGHISQGPDPTLFLYLPGVHAEHEPPVPVYPASHLQAVLPASELE